MSMDWWCETSNVTGCHGQRRQFVLDTSPADVDKFEVDVSSLEQGLKKLWVCSVEDNMGSLVLERQTTKNIYTKNIYTKNI